MNSKVFQAPDWIVELQALFEKKYSRKPKTIVPLPASGSERRYCRFTFDGGSLLGAWNPDTKENLSFIEWSSFFEHSGIRVPKVYATSESANCYLCQDLGDVTLLQKLLEEKKNSFSITTETENLYKSSLQELAKMVSTGSNEIKKHTEVHTFDRTAILRDLNYFKYYFLKLSGVSFSEQMLEEEFQKIADHLSVAETGFFVFRDFQGRNIMIHEKEPWLIDFQSAMRGPLQYDPASLLFQAKANLDETTREKLLSYYIEALGERISFDKNSFLRFYPAFALIRMLQTLGAYGFRGFIQKKDHFLSSISPAVQNLNRFFETTDVGIHLPEITRIASLFSENYSEEQKNNSVALNISIKSFSYKSGIPADTSGNGGGFVFDCRSLENPGRYAEYKSLTGLHTEVVNFLEEKSRWKEFMNETFNLVKSTIDTYTARGFNHLIICFGCTGGQHRSVASVEELAKRLSGRNGIKVEVEHTESQNWVIPYQPE